MSRSTERFDTLRQLQVGGRHFQYHSLEALAEDYPHIRRFPYSLKVLLENLLRHADHEAVGEAQIHRFVDPERRGTPDEIAFFPFRVLMQDFTGVPAIVDLAAMRDAMLQLGGDAARINPLSRVDLVIDHSVMVDRYGSADAFEFNMALEMQRNRERYEFLRWGQKAFDNFRVVPPGTGICHQV
ncbi:aconitase family protein, partial [Sedimenticola sp.]|uniref:aconitase family protein n=1 Tax=Sedimenticola sp. TaxID=1940285 RepID=UPI003D0CA7DF